MDYRESHIAGGNVYDSALAADSFDSYMARWEECYLRKSIPPLFPGRIPRYLDFACGTGRITTIMARMALEVVGVDISESMLAVAAQKVPSATLVCGDITTQRLELGLFDAITSFRFFGNAQPDLRSAVLRALNPLQQIGGYLIVNNHRNPSSVANLIGRARGRGSKMDLTHSRFRRLLKDSGYTIVSSRPIGAWQFRARLMVAAGSNRDREERLERLFGAQAWVSLAPDAVHIARKVRHLDEA